MALEVRDLNEKSARAGRFAVRVLNPRILEYTYTKCGQTKTGSKLEAFLVSSEPSTYCLASARGDASKVQASLVKFTHGSTWLLSNATLEKDQRWNSTPVKQTISLTQPTNTAAYKGEIGELAEEIVPGATLPDIAEIHDKRVIDVMGIASDYAESLVNTARGPRKKITKASLRRRRQLSCAWRTKWGLGGGPQKVHVNLAHAGGGGCTDGRSFEVVLEVIFEGW